MLTKLRIFGAVFALAFGLIAVSVSPSSASVWRDPPARNPFVAHFAGMSAYGQAQTTGAKVEVAGYKYFRGVQFYADFIGLTGTVNGKKFHDKIISLPNRPSYTFFVKLPVNQEYEGDIELCSPAGACPEFHYTVAIGNPIDYVITSALRSAHVGRTYNFTLRASGGTRPYTWKSLKMPPGLRLKSSGLITGTPLRAGTFPVSIEAIDMNHKVTGNMPFSLTVS